MKVIRPITYDKSTMLVSTTAIEAVTAWSSATTYAVDDEVLYNDYIWVSLQAGNTNKQPDLFDPVAQSDEADQWWRRKQPGNQSAMFATNISTRTEVSGDLTAVVDTGEFINTVLLKNLFGSTVRVQAEDAATNTSTFDSGDVSIDQTVISDWYEYFFEESEIAEQVLFTGIPPYKTTRLTITISAVGGATACGIAVMGSIFELGEALLGCDVGIIDFSEKETDPFGNTQFNELDFADTVSANFSVDRGRFPKVKKILAGLRATPAAWILSEDDDLITFGWARDFSLSVQYPTHVIASIEIEGLI